VAGAHAFKCVSTNLGGSDNIAISISTLCVHDDHEVSIHEFETKVAVVWEM